MDKVSSQILEGYFQGIFPMSNSREDDNIFFNICFVFNGLGLSDNQK